MLINSRENQRLITGDHLLSFYKKIVVRDVSKNGLGYPVNVLLRPPRSRVDSITNFDVCVVSHKTT